MTASAFWYVLHAKPHREVVAERHLRRKGIEVFYPQLDLPAYAGRRRAIPLFPSYLFVQLDLMGQGHEVMWTPGVRCLVGAGGHPTPLDADVVAFLKRNAGADGRLPARSNLQVGDEVEIVRGPFAGLVGIIQNPPDARGRIRVLMRLLNRRPVTVHVPAGFVKTGWVA
ncbi:MAG TPA: transcription termination/antitermination NusG family protein [Candidatus Tectomicrobia bacterium]|nr:transcription termination/antitermination NusG family protein [Candidatus Tectomicrobia bacterium]